jgi:predicted DNA-binding WGR domain protein
VPDELRSPIKHHLVLHRIDPEQGVRRFYSLMIERDLFGTIRLVRNWGGLAPTAANSSRSSRPRSRRVRRWRPSAGRSGGRAIRICETGLSGKATSARRNAAGPVHKLRAGCTTSEHS